MDAREQRGMVIAAKCKLNKSGQNWLVPSQSAVGQTYRVDAEKKTCSCPDHQEAGFKCKHIFAVECVIQRELFPDGSVVETRQVTVTEKRTYTQDWPAYNKAQSIEKSRLQELLHDLCRQVEEPAPKKTGRKPHSAKDRIFSMVYKVYVTLSSRRFSTDLREAHERGYTTKAIPGLKVCQFFEDESFTPILRALVEASAAPLKAVESDFAIDSSGFGTNKFERWYDEKYGCERQRSVWIKTHICCGVKTNVVTAISISDKYSHDTKEFAGLVRQTAKTFQISEMSADKAYVSAINFDVVADCGGQAFIAFKANSNGNGGGTLAKMYHYFKYRQDEFMAHYHKRSNVESTFSMVKRKFGDSVRSKTETAMTNEVLCKMICHNLCCLISAECELGIVSVF